MGWNKQENTEEGQGAHRRMVSFLGHENEMREQQVSIPSAQKIRPATQIRGPTKHSQTYHL
eukprot:8511614-Ditylum_brightwellii.AAC.1